MAKESYITNLSPLDEEETNLKEQVKSLTKAYNDLRMKVDQSFVRIGQRFDIVEKVGVSKPPTPVGIAAEGRQGSFHVRWQPIRNIDGYVLTMSSDTAGQLIEQRIPINDPEAVKWSIPWGNVSSTRYFQVWAVRGGEISNPSEIVSAASVAFGAGESAPTAPAQTPQSPERVAPTLGGVSTA